MARMSPDGGREARPTEYLSFLLRLWRVNAVGTPEWRASLQRPGTLETLCFADLGGLVAFLSGEIEERTAPEPAEDERPSGR